MRGLYRGLRGVLWMALSGLLATTLPTARAAVAASTERVALVIGNSAYPDSALPNPRNDARSMADLLERAGFQVDIRIDASRVNLVEAVSRFGGRLREPSVRLAVFFYAGHGLQIDSRNFLVPVDAKIQAAADVPRQTVDVSDLLGYMNNMRERSFVAILDACRDNPWAGSYRAKEFGLSARTAPAGMLLAYSTSPGMLAFDGNGANSIYTRYLVKEMAEADVSLEAAFKRVRAGVIEESNGKQIPWENSSLLHDVVMFPLSASLRAEAANRPIDDELAEWEGAHRNPTIKSLAGFIRAYPTGNYNELAQSQLDRVLEAELRKAEQARVAAARQSAVVAEIQRLKAQADELARQAAAERESARLAAVREEASRVAAAQAQALAAARVELESRQQREQARQDALRVAQQRAAEAEAIRLQAVQDERIAAQVRASEAEAARREIARLAALTEGYRVAMERVSAVSVALPPNPYFSGMDPHRRRYQPGEVHEFRVVDKLSDKVKTEAFKVTAVNEVADRVEFNGGEFVSDLMGNIVTNRMGTASTPRQFYPAELVVGRKWRTQFRQQRYSGPPYTFKYDLQVVARESITVPAGTFDAYRIEARGLNVEVGGRILRTIWVAPGVNADIAQEIVVQRRNGTLDLHERHELSMLSRQ